MSSAPRGEAWLGCVYALAERITTDDYSEEERATWDADLAAAAVDDGRLMAEEAACAIVDRTDSYSAEPGAREYIAAARYLLYLALADADDAQLAGRIEHAIDALGVVR